MNAMKSVSFDRCFMLDEVVNERKTTTKREDEEKRSVSTGLFSGCSSS